MPRPRQAEKVVGRHFSWLLDHRNGVWYADGRSGNAVNAGRHSLGTHDPQEAHRRLQELDKAVAVKLGRIAAPAPKTPSPAQLPLEYGQRLYLEYASRPHVMRGVRPSSLKRYR